VTWDVFKWAFLEKYFPEDVRNNKEMEFLELKQGKMTMAKYETKFEELVRYFPHYQGRDGESSKCVKFLNGLRPEVKQAMNYQGVCQFPLLVNMCQIWDEDSRDRAAYYRSTSPMKNKNDVAPCGACRPWIFFIIGVLCFLKMNGSGIEKEERRLETPLHGEDELRRSSRP